MNFKKIWFPTGTLRGNTDTLQPEFVWKRILDFMSYTPYICTANCKKKKKKISEIIIQREQNKLNLSKQMVMTHLNKWSSFFIYCDKHF